MANGNDSSSKSSDTTSGGKTDKPARRRAPRALERGRAGGRDDRLDEDLNRERLEPGLNAEGTGGAGADPAKAKGGNSNT